MLPAFRRAVAVALLVALLILLPDQLFYSFVADRCWDLIVRLGRAAFFHRHQDRRK